MQFYVQVCYKLDKEIDQQGPQVFYVSENNIPSRQRDFLFHVNL
jgi:hypothetical protein